MSRLFVAFTPPEDVRRAAARLCRDMRGARPVPLDQMHLTLRFLGDVPDEEAALIAEGLETVRADRFEIRLEGVGSFGRPPRVLWAGVAPKEPVVRLHEAVEAALEGLAPEPEDRAFSPHFTLARLKNAPPVQVRAFLAENAAFVTEPFEVCELVLYSSVLSPQGATHQARLVVPLK